MKVVHDGETIAYELCCFCWQRTNYWHSGKDVAVCPSCAKRHKVAAVPEKAAWCAQEAERLKPYLTPSGGYHCRSIPVSN